MKKRLLSFFAMVLAAFFLSLFSGQFNVYAQGGDARLNDPKPTPTPKGGAKAPAKAAAPVTPTLTFDQEAKGKLDPRGSEKEGGNLIEDHILNAKSEDLLIFQIQSAETSLALQIRDKDKNEVAIAKDAKTGDFKISSPGGGLPADGEYRVRVVGAVSKTAVPFSLKVVRVGLTPNVYNDRFNQIVINYRESDPASVDETLTKLEELTKADSSKPGAFELLGIIYLYNKPDIAKAEQAMDQAIKLNGAAVVKITYDGQWRRMAKLRSGKFGWQDARSGWLRIRPGQVEVTDPANKVLATVSGAQITELSKILTANSNLITVTGERRQFVFEPGSGKQQEADLVIKLVQTHVMKRTN
ncbi:MAG: tetratricopeptide repeat protein [Blastocatellia bacterium]